MAVDFVTCPPFAVQSRIKELDSEKVALRRQQQELRKEHQQLLRDKKAKEGRIADLDQRAYNVQMLKFGQEIDLELLDRIGTTRGAEELQEQLKAQEASQARELRQWDRKIEQMQDQMMSLTMENTQCLQVCHYLVWLSCWGAVPELHMLPAGRVVIPVPVDRCS